MNQRSRRWRGVLALAGTGVLAAAACAPGGGSSSGTEVSVIGTWGGDEQTAFLEMVKPWEQETGNTVKYTGTRDLNAVLTTGVASGVLTMVSTGSSREKSGRVGGAALFWNAAFLRANTPTARL